MAWEARTTLWVKTPRRGCDKIRASPGASRVSGDLMTGNLILDCHRAVPATELVVVASPSRY